MIIEDNGKKYEFWGEYRPVGIGDHYLDAFGCVSYASVSLPQSRAIVHPVPVVHEFGGVRLQEVDYRPPRIGEWALDSHGRPFYVHRSFTGDYPILKPYGGDDA